jgi:type I restriction enzyme S subunit
MELIADFKHTNVGLIPYDWKIYCIRDLIDLLTDYDANGSFASVAENVKVYDHEEFAWYVRSTDLENNSNMNSVKYVDESSYKFLKKTALFGGELLFLKRGDIGNVYLFEMKTEKATVAPNLYLLKLNSVSDPKYLYYYFISSLGQKQLKSKNAGSTLGALYKNDVKDIIVALPPTKSEQTAIATALSDMDALISNLERLIEKKRMILFGVIKKLTYPDSDWKTFRVKDIGMVGRGRVISHREIDHSVNKLYPVYSSQTSDNGIMGYIDSYDFEGEYITWTTDGVNAGTVFYREGKFNCTNVCGTIKLFEFDPYYISVLLGQVTDKYVSKNLANPKLMNDVMKNIPIQIPAIPLQKEYGNIIMCAEKEIKVMSELHAKYMGLKQGMMQSLLTGKIRLA